MQKALAKTLNALTNARNLGDVDASAKNHQNIVDATDPICNWLNKGSAGVPPAVRRASPLTPRKDCRRDKSAVHQLRVLP
jgi:hypothetical protein